MSSQGVDWFRRLRAGVADPVLHARLAEVAPELNEADRRSLVFDLVTGSRTLSEALAEALPTERRGPVADALAPTPTVEEAVSVLESIGRSEQARRLAATGQLEGGEFEAQMEGREVRRPFPSSRVTSKDEAPTGDVDRAPGSARSLDLDPADEDDLLADTRPAGFPPGIGAGSEAEHAEEDEPPPQLLLPPPIGTTDIGGTDLPARAPRISSSADLERLERALERLDRKLDGLRTQLGVFTALAAAALAAWAGFALGRAG